MRSLGISHTVSRGLSRAIRYLIQQKPAHLLVFVIILSACVIFYVRIGSRYPQSIAILEGKDSQMAIGSNPTYRGSRAKAMMFDMADSAIMDTGNDSELTGDDNSTRSGPRLVLKGQIREEDGDGDGDSHGPASQVDLSIKVGGKSWRRLQAAVKKAEAALFPWKPKRVKRVDCWKLFDGDSAEMERAKFLEQNDTVRGLADKAVASLASSSCRAFRRMFGFITSSLSEEERNFPIAFSLLIFKDAEQVLNLLRAIYRPQNYYCIHMDIKSDHHFQDAITAIASCLPNVFLSSRSVSVSWGTFTVLEPEIICMEDLWQYKKWKYFINLTGQEFPLKTNYELVKILTAFHGANSLEGTRKRANWGRWKKTSKVPRGIILTKGSVHITVNRDFVDFVLHSKVAQQFLNWSRTVSVPDEVFFSSLNHSPDLGIRGTYLGEPETASDTYPFLTRFKNWGDGPFNYPCASGKRVRAICILSSGDLPLLGARPELFANKFYASESRVTLDCLAERLFNRTRDECLGHANFDLDVDYYANMPFVKNMVTNSTFNTTS